MDTLETQFHVPMINLLLSTADDKLFLGHRNSDWTGIAPILEADIAFSSLAQDDIAHASAFYELTSTLNNEKPDAIAFGRKSDEYLCADIVTKSDKFDWANAIARQFYCNVYDYIRLKMLSNSNWSPLANLSKRICAEQTVHVDHVNSWINHLGNGNGDSNKRIQTALDEYSECAGKLFEAPEGIEELFKKNILPCEDCFYTTWKEKVDIIANRANLTINVKANSTIGARRGKHDEDFNRSLSELQEVFNTDPLATW